MFSSWSCISFCPVHVLIFSSYLTFLLHRYNLFWTLSSLSIAGKVCPDPVTPKNSKITVNPTGSGTTNFGKYVFGDKLNYLCDPGYMITGTKQDTLSSPRTCVEEGGKMKFDGKEPTCTSMYTPF